MLDELGMLSWDRSSWTGTAAPEKCITPWGGCEHLIYRIAASSNLYRSSLIWHNISFFKTVWRLPFLPHDKLPKLDFFKVSLSNTIIYSPLKSNLFAPQSGMGEKLVGMVPVYTTLAPQQLLACRKEYRAAFTLPVKTVQTNNGLTRE